MKLNKINYDRLEYIIKNKLYEKRLQDINVNNIIRKLNNEKEYLNYKEKFNTLNKLLLELNIVTFNDWEIDYRYTESIREEITINHNKNIETVLPVLFFIVESSNTIDEVYNKIEEHYNITMERLWHTN